MQMQKVKQKNLLIKYLFTLIKIKKKNPVVLKVSKDGILVF